ncbi:TetR/AcrR family transcriptional regulator [Spirosoma foliorum]|uniref:TetR/AcrR family transcriptional regulator n=1 Tax=Spirosoma foliorum TaxID=2710596 RepID=A0A7G5GZC5_9BACT|nr:TetR/AcrR family transcriptional regulator [Spirosoma foliorum]QMW04217.1 TetR/AcrR family transcriptional regulator [Spirosoma foliorum]
MAHAKVEHDVVIDKLMEVFRSSGYDGSSMATLAEATQLKKASLYHRFPQGKQAMAHAVLSYVADWTQTRIVDVLFSASTPKERLEKALKAIDELYDGGRLDCILRALSHGSEANIFQNEIAAVFQLWIDAFTHLALDFGYDQKESDRLAKLAITKIQGTLILARAFGQPSLFTEALDELRSLFTR